MTTVDALGETTRGPWEGTVVDRSSVKGYTPCDDRGKGWQGGAATRAWDVSQFSSNINWVWISASRVTCTVRDDDISKVVRYPDNLSCSNSPPDMSGGCGCAFACCAAYDEGENDAVVFDVGLSVNEGTTLDPKRCDWWSSPGKKWGASAGANCGRYVGKYVRGSESANSCWYSSKSKLGRGKESAICGEADERSRSDGVER